MLLLGPSAVPYPSACWDGLKQLQLYISSHFLLPPLLVLSSHTYQDNINISYANNSISNPLRKLSPLNSKGRFLLPVLCFVCVRFFCWDIALPPSPLNVLTKIDFLETQF